MSFAPRSALSWWLGFRIWVDGWSKSCRLSGRNLRRARRDKIPGDLSSQELALLGSMPIPGFSKLRVELAMNVLDALELSEASALVPASISPHIERKCDQRQITQAHSNSASATAALQAATRPTTS